MNDSFFIQMKSAFRYSICNIAAPTSLIQTVARTESASWAIPLVFSYQAIFVKNPTGVVNYMAYLEPMTNLSWIGVAVFLIIIPPFLYVVFAFNPNPNDNVSLAESYGAVFVAILMLGSPNDPKNVSTRIIFLWYVQANKYRIYILKTFWCKTYSRL